MITVKRQIKLTRVARGRRRVEPAGKEPPTVEASRIPRISRLMALAIQFDRMLQSGEVADLME